MTRTTTAKNSAFPRAALWTEARQGAAVPASAPRQARSAYPALKINGKENADVYLQSLDIQVEVAGNIASTRYTMVFKNKTGRVLEGELTFPLPEGRSVTYYALDINGKMREAVPVEKAKATEVFFGNKVEKRIKVKLDAKKADNRGNVYRLWAQKKIAEHVKDPNGEECYYGHSATRIGGRISADNTRGYGPEQFLLKSAIKGKYRVYVNYFSDTQVTLAGPATVMAEIFTKYADKTEQRRVVCLQMSNVKKRDGQNVEVAEFEF